jgi:hypothetical protein
MNKYDESNKNLNQSKLNPNLFYNGLTDNSKGNNINPVFINNVFINNFNNNNQNNNNNNNGFSIGEDGFPRNNMNPNNTNNSNNNNFQNNPFNSFNNNYSYPDLGNDNNNSNNNNGSSFGNNFNNNNNNDFKSNSFQNNFNNNMNNNNNNNFNVFQGDTSKAKIGILPRPESNENKKSFLICPNNAGDRVNIMFITGAGLKTVIISPINLPVKDLFKEYIKKMGQDPRVLGKYIYFLYNGLKIDINEPKTVFQFGLNASNVIMVVDTSNLLGGSF